MRRHPLSLLSILVWPLLLLLIVALAQPRAPVCQDWDSFSYLNAAKAGHEFVVLGLGRTPFCLLGQWLDPWSVWLYGKDPFGLFRLWMWSGALLQVLALAVGGMVAVKRLGLVAAHLALMLYATHSRQLVLTMGVWPETWALAMGLLAMAMLAMPRAPWLIRVTGSGLFCLLMVLMKEVFVAFVPALMLLVWMLAPRRHRWFGRTATAVGYALFAAAIPLVLVVALLPRLMPGVAEARAELLREYTAQSNVGLDFFLPNLIDALRWGIYDNFAVVVLCLLSLGRLAAGLVERRRRWRWLGQSLWVVALLVVPLVLVAATGQAGMMARYTQMMVPGVALLAALWLVRPLPAAVSSAQNGPLVLAAVFTPTLLLHGWGHTLYYVERGREERERYHAWQALLDQRLGLYVADDTWAACYLYTYSQEHLKRGGEWVILWPGWEPGKQGRAPDAWIRQQAEAGRGIVISDQTVQRTGMTPSELVPGWDLRPIQGGWLLGRASGADGAR